MHSSSSDARCVRVAAISQDDDGVHMENHSCAEEEKHASTFDFKQLDRGVEDIDLTNLRLTQIEDFTEFRCLKTLVLRQNHISRIEKLECVGSTLEYLDLYENRIDVMENLGQLTRLTYLDLSFNGIRIIQGLEGLRSLKDLFLVNNKIAAIPEGAFTPIPQLRQLELGSNRIRTIENLHPLTQLQELYLGRNKLTKIQNLEALVHLRKLSLQSNRIVDIGDGLKCLVALEVLRRQALAVTCWIFCFESLVAPCRNCISAQTASRSSVASKHWSISRFLTSGATE
jgi:protein phosphatase 1 regulatory subunit 7